MEHNASLNEYRDMLATKQRKNFFTTPKFIFAAGSIALLLIGFGSGVAYQKGKTTSTAQAASAMQDSRFGGMQGFGGGMRDTNRAFGTVSAISDSSITVTTRSNSSVTYTLSSSTTVTDDGNSASIGDIQTGDTVTHTGQL